MATLVFDDASVVIDGNDISDHVKSVSMPTGVEELDETAMGNNTRINKGGLETYSIEIEIFQDFASGNIDAILWPLRGTTVVIVIKPTSAVVSATNPTYTATVLVSSYTPLDGSVGDLAMTTLGLSSAGDLVRAESA